MDNQPIVEIPDLPPVEAESAEPLRDKAFWIGLLGAGLGVLTAFNVDLDPGQIAAILGFGAPVITILMWQFGRRDVVPVGKANAAVAAAAEMPSGTAVEGFAKGSGDRPRLT